MIFWIETDRPHWGTKFKYVNVQFRCWQPLHSKWNLLKLCVMPKSSFCGFQCHDTGLLILYSLMFCFYICVCVCVQRWREKEILIKRLFSDELPAHYCYQNIFCHANEHTGVSKMLLNFDPYNKVLIFCTKIWCDINFWICVGISHVLFWWWQ